jgi:hypothetical protein
MKARQLIGQASYGPAVLNVLYQAFDEAWALLAPRYGDNPAAVEAARIQLANIVLSLAGEGATDVAALRDAALKPFDRPSTGAVPPKIDLAPRDAGTAEPLRRSAGGVGDGKP